MTNLVFRDTSVILGRVERFLRTSIIVCTNHTKGRDDVKAILPEREHSIYLVRHSINRSGELRQSDVSNLIL